MLKSGYKIKFYPWGSGAHYDVRLSKNSSISFSGYEGLIFTRQLSVYEEEHLIKRLDGLSIPLPRWRDERLIFDPDVLSKLKIRSRNLKIDLSWLASEVKQNPNEYSSVVHISNLIFELLPFHLLDFDPPLIE